MIEANDDSKSFDKRMRGRRVSRTLKQLVGFAKYLFVVLLVTYIACVALDHNQLREMKKQALKLEIELLERQLGK